ncbi:hypothetical protein AFLA_003209 [Aspergillus flavus NRRL3357]|nr:hypothetical protein AFLA_003209 [Aspergillus flavus NRRL3357]
MCFSRSSEIWDIHEVAQGVLLRFDLKTDDAYVSSNESRSVILTFLRCDRKLCDKFSETTTFLDGCCIPCQLTC